MTQTHFNPHSIHISDTNIIIHQEMNISMMDPDNMNEFNECITLPHVLINKKKSHKNSIEEYMDLLYSKGEKLISNSTKQFKTKNLKRGSEVENNMSETVIPSVDQYDDFLKYNYNLLQLKNISKHYKLKISGNKPDLTKRIFLFLYFSHYIIKIQKIFRGNLQRFYNRLHGPAFLKRSICNNETDFITMDELKEVKFDNFISYKDEDGFIYGFQISSLHNLFLKNEGSTVNNPYNRKEFPQEINHQLKTIVRLSLVLKLPLQLKIQDDEVKVPEKKSIELRAYTLFQKIDELGNYTDAKWFLQLPRGGLIKFIRELIDIWNYRAQLPNQIKQNILPPRGELIRSLNNDFLQNAEIKVVQKEILTMMERLVTNGVDRDSKSLGAYYVLSALTLVSYEAATALPWLYQSVSY